MSDASVLFGLIDGHDRYAASEVKAEIRITDDTGEEIYSGAKSVSPDDFGYFTSEAYGLHFLAEVRIPASEIEPGKSSGGYMVESGEVLLDALSAEDKFKDDSIFFYDVTPGESYTIRFSGYDLP